MKKLTDYIEKNEGIVSYVQRMSLYDGPGIRTTLFFKGCNLRCKWCHNPETLSSEPEIEWIQSKCMINTCKNGSLSLVEGRITRDDYTCTQCYACISECYPEALKLIGKHYTVDELCQIIHKDRTIFERSDGGVTFSGGEPMIQFPFLLEMLKKLRNTGIHSIIQTNLISNWEKYAEVLPYTNLFMCDLKLIDSNRHKSWTGGNNELILSNIAKLDVSGASYCIRTPVIPGVNDNEEDLRQIATFVRSLKKVMYYELIPFHSLGSYKYHNLGLPYEFNQVKELSEERMKRIKRQFEFTNNII